MSDRAKQLTDKLRKEFGDIPQWKTALTRQGLERGESEWDITKSYHNLAHDYKMYRPLARMVHRECKEEIGKHSGITTDTVHTWLARDGLDDAQVKAKYRQLFNHAQDQKRRAERLLVEMRRDIAECYSVGLQRVLRWVEKGLTDEHIEAKYREDIVRSKHVNRAKALQFRLEEEITHKPGIPELLPLFYKNLDDDGIVEHYRKKKANPEDEDVLAIDALPIVGKR